jgi:replication initiation protein RepC
MEQEYPTTPFGGRTMSLAMVASQITARECPEGRPAHKWKLFRSITECKDALGVSDRALAVLNALLTCLPDTVMTAGPDLTVFPSNAQLSLRTNGMPETTLRRHLAALVDAQLIIRRDSPNGKRYARRGQGGGIEQAYGFDVTPILARAEEFENLAAEIRQERRVAALARERVSILRRDIAKMIAFGLEEGIQADWQAFHAAFLRLSGRLPRFVTGATLEPLAAQLYALAVEIGKVLESHVSAQNADGNDSHSGAHYQNSNTDPLNELEPGFSRSPGAKSEPNPQPSRSPPKGFPLGMILRACPDIAMYNRHGISSWQDLVATAGTVRSALGISPSAWDEALKAMGDADAAVTIAAILQRAEEIKSPGGYLRGLTAKAAAGQFSTGPMIMALMRRQTPKPNAVAS